MHNPQLLCVLVWESNYQPIRIWSYGRNLTEEPFKIQLDISPMSQVRYWGFCNELGQAAVGAMLMCIAKALD
jgi:hypothetical protein